MPDLDVQRNIIIGVDGGGTKTALAAIDAVTHCKVSSSRAGSIYMGAVGKEKALLSMKEAFEGLHLSSTDRVRALAVGDPAVDDKQEGKDSDLLRLVSQSGLFPPDCFYIARSDVFMALYALTHGKPGALVVAGTGSMGVGFKEPYRPSTQNEILNVGGWAFPTNDPGSGYSIAISGICAAIDAFDQVGPSTLLCSEVLIHFQTPVPRDLIELFNSGRLCRSDIASFSVKVDQCAQKGDPIAVAILQKSGESLGKYALSLLSSIASEEAIVGYYGSVLMNCEIVRSVFTSTISSKYPQAKIVPLTVSPEEGAAWLALDSLDLM